MVHIEKAEVCLLCMHSEIKIQEHLPEKGGGDENSQIKSLTELTVCIFPCAECAAVVSASHQLWIYIQCRLSADGLKRSSSTEWSRGLCWGQWSEQILKHWCGRRACTCPPVLHGFSVTSSESSCSRICQSETLSQWISHSSIFTIYPASLLE